MGYKIPLFWNFLHWRSQVPNFPSLDRPRVNSDKNQILTRIHVWCVVASQYIVFCNCRHNDVLFILYVVDTHYRLFVYVCFVIPKKPHIFIYQCLLSSKNISDACFIYCIVISHMLSLILILCLIRGWLLSNKHMNKRLFKFLLGFSP